MSEIIFYENLSKLNAPFKEEFKIQFEAFLDKGWFVLGEQVETFEANFAKYCGSKYCIGVANGLDALELAIQVYNFEKGSEIIVPSNTYIATILAILNCGMVPVLVEPDLLSYNIDPNKIEEKITSKTKAIMVVHLYGQPCKMDEIVKIASVYSLKVIEDCAQSHGTMFKDKKTGTFGDIGAFSFYPTKNLGALGDSGAIITSDENIYLELKAKRNYGSEKKYYNKYIGRNSRLDEIQAMFLNIKLNSLNEIIEHKRQLAEIYNTLLTNEVIKPLVTPEAYHTYHIYNIRTNERDQLKKWLFNKGIITEIHYPVPPHLQEGYLGIFNSELFPISKLIHDTTLSLPISYANTKFQIEKTCKVINEFFN